MLNPMIPLDPRGEGVSNIFNRSTHQPFAPDTPDGDLFSRRNQQAVSREAAQECSPGRKPWVKVGRAASPSGAEEQPARPRPRFVQSLLA